MPETMFAGLLVALQVFQPHLTRPAFNRMVVIAVGWVLTTASKRAITETLVVTGVAGKQHHEAFHRFFSRGTWNPDHLGISLIFKLRSVGMPLRFVLDDTLAGKKGALVYGNCSHLDPVRSTKAFRVFTFGHCWVVLCMIVDVPFSRRPWALPVLFRLYRSVKDCARKGCEYRKKTELGRELVELVADWFGSERIELAADCAYCNSTLLDGLAQHVVLFGSMRPDAVLTDRPEPPSRSRKGGRPACRGRVLPKPEELAADPSVPWRKCRATLYRQKRTVEYKTIRAQWYRGAGTRMVLVVITRCWTGNIPWRVYFCTDPNVSVRELLEGYCRRWSIEVAFRELKQQFGFADSCARSKNAVLRTAPFIAMLYTTLVIWFLEVGHKTALGTPPTRPWYPHKQQMCFNDILRAARRALAESDVLVPSLDFDKLKNPSAHRRGGHRARIPIAA
jgi:hypothetical protein